MTKDIIELTIIVGSLTVRLSLEKLSLQLA